MGWFNVYISFLLLNLNISHLAACDNCEFEAQILNKQNNWLKASYQVFLKFTFFGHFDGFCTHKNQLIRVPIITAVNGCLILPFIKITKSRKPLKIQTLLSVVQMTMQWQMVYVMRHCLRLNHVKTLNLIFTFHSRSMCFMSALDKMTTLYKIRYRSRQWQHFYCLCPTNDNGWFAVLICNHWKNLIYRWNDRNQCWSDMVISWW